MPPLRAIRQARPRRAVVTGIETIMRPIRGASNRLEEKWTGSRDEVVVAVGVLGKIGMVRVKRPACQAKWPLGAFRLSGAIRTKDVGGNRTHFYRVAAGGLAVWLRHRSLEARIRTRTGSAALTKRRAAITPHRRHSPSWMRGGGKRFAPREELRRDLGSSNFYSQRFAHSCSHVKDYDGSRDSDPV